MSVKIYDLRTNDYPDEVEFRTLQVYTCLCCSRTNKAMSTGFPGTYLSPRCPNSLKDWHTELLKLEYEISKAFLESTKIALKSKVRTILDEHRDEIIDDIEGDVDISLDW